MRLLFRIIIVGIFIFLGGREFGFADGPDVEAEPQEEETREEEFNWFEAIDQILGREIDAGLPVHYYGNFDTHIESLTMTSTVGCSAIFDITSFLGAGFYLKNFRPTQPRVKVPVNTVPGHAGGVSHLFLFHR
jgi:hypothetical protein